jgi:hypothetical protein
MEERMKKVKSIVIALIMLVFSVSSAWADEVGRREFADILFKIMGISEQVSKSVAGLSDEEIFDFETDYLWRNYGSESMRGLSGAGSLKVGEFTEVVYHYLLTQNLKLDRDAATFKEMAKALAGLGIKFSRNRANDVLDRDELLKILNSPMLAKLKAEAYQPPVGSAEGPDKEDVLGTTGTDPDTGTNYSTWGLEDNDYDDDGYLDDNDAFPEDPAEWVDNDNDGTGDNADTDDDNDNYTDADEIANATDPLDSASTPPDNDNDFVSDLNDPDDDNDDYTDADETANATDPLDSASTPPDNDGDFVSDLNDPDDDNDGVSDVLEIARGTYYLNADSDGDGTNDLNDDSYGWPAALDGNDNGISDKREGWGWEIGLGKEQLADLQTVSDTFEDNADNNSFDWYSRAEDLVWDATEGNSINDIPGGFDKDEIRQLVKSELREDIRDMVDNDNYRKFDAVLTKIADAQAGKVLTDIYNNRVRVDQYILRPNSNTMQLLNITLRGNSAKADGVDIGNASILEWKVGFNKSLDSLASGSLKTLPWDSYLSAEPTYASMPDYYPESSSITIARNDNSVMESKSFGGLTPGLGDAWMQDGNDIIIAFDIDVNGVVESFNTEDNKGEIIFQPFFDTIGGNLIYSWSYVYDKTGMGFGFPLNPSFSISLLQIDEHGIYQDTPSFPPPEVTDMHSSLKYSLNAPNYTEWQCIFARDPLNSETADVIIIPRTQLEWNDIKYSE